MTSSHVTIQEQRWEEIGGFDGSVGDLQKQRAAQTPADCGVSTAGCGKHTAEPLLCFAEASRELVFISGHRVNDGLWHTVSVDTRNLQVTLTLDSEPPSTTELWEQLESRGSFYLGGK